MIDPYQMAHFKFGLIAPVVQGTFPDASAIAYYRRITEKPLIRPDGVSTMYKANSVQRWEELYKKGGMDALLPKARKDKSSARAISNDAIAEIYRIKDKYPRLNATQVRYMLIDEGAITARVSVRCIQRFFKVWNLKAGLPDNSAKDRKAFEEEYFGGMWQADSCHFPFVPDNNGTPRKTYLLMIIDDYSRLVVGSRFFFNDNAINFQTVLKDSVAAYGIPNKIYVDNGAPYINLQTEFICDSIGATLIHAKIRDGAAKGKIERMFKTAQESWLYGIDIAAIKSIQELNERFAEFIRAYNLAIHSSTGQTPMDRYLQTRDRIKSPKSYEWLQECFLHRVKRKVNNDSTIKIANILYDAPQQFIKHTVDVRYSPDRDDHVFILAENQRYPLRKTNKVENARTKRSDLRLDYGQALNPEPRLDGGNDA